jgi:hypothetical protein
VLWGKQNLVRPFHPAPVDLFLNADGSWWGIRESKHPRQHCGTNPRPRAICDAISINDSWPKLRWKILFTPQKETGVSRQKKETERFRNIDPTNNGGLGMRKPEKS